MNIAKGPFPDSALMQEHSVATSCIAKLIGAHLSRLVVSRIDSDERKVVLRMLGPAGNARQERTKIQS